MESKPDGNKKLNCWEFMKCGREPGGERERELGSCPAAVATRADGVHDGKNGGRACWAIAGTFCEGKHQGSFVDKFESCSECEFYILVSQETDTREYMPACEIIKKLKDGAE